MTPPPAPFTCEVIAIGTELLLGPSVDTNSTWIGEQLALAGIDSHFHSQVGDNLPRIISLLRIALGRSSAVIVCGGLGPTHDDLTREALAEVMGAPLVSDEGIAERIRTLFRTRARAMPENNLRQALVPHGAIPIEPRLGTAPGLICPIGDQVLYALPGVPHEMKEMVERAVLPDLRRRAGADAVIVSRTLRSWGDSESGLAERLRPVIEGLDRNPGVTLAFLASGVEGIRVRLTAKAADRAAALARISAVESEVAALLGNHLFSAEDETMEEVVLRLLAARGLRFGVADGVTGGLLSHRLESRLDRIPEASEAYAGAIVGTDAVSSLLDPGDEADSGADRVQAMAESVTRFLGCPVGLALQGEIRPDPESGRPIGTLRIGLHRRGRGSSAEVRLSGDPESFRRLACISALNALRLALIDAR